MDITLGFVEICPYFNEIAHLTSVDIKDEKIFESGAKLFEYFLIFLTYQFINDTEKGDSTFCLAKSLGAVDQF